MQTMQIISGFVI